jgi:hypothetical protein
MNNRQLIAFGTLQLAVIVILEFPDIMKNLLTHSSSFLDGALKIKNNFHEKDRN